MGDYPDPDEEYELMYADDLELLRDIEDNTGKLKKAYTCVQKIMCS